MLAFQQVTFKRLPFFWTAVRSSTTHATKGRRHQILALPVAAMVE